ncbi:MAG: AraC family transcriptional regulator [Opitutaceae bacterium]|nr:AraC family transcriptional regulator [Opitutaceae bacterium]
MSIIHDNKNHFRVTPLLNLPIGARPFRRKPLCGLGVWVFVERLMPNKWPRHSHDHWQITFAFGAAACDVKWWTPSGHTFKRRLGGGDFWIVPPGWMHSVQWRVKADVISIYIDPMQMEHVGELRQDAVVDGLANYVSVRPIIAEQLAYLLSFGSMPNGKSDWRVACAGSSLAAAFMEAHHMLGKGTIKPIVGLTAAIVHEVKRFVTEQPRERVPVAELARSVGTSPRNFRRNFRMVMGESPQKWALRQKAHRAKQLLQSGHSIKETVLKGVFSDSRHLNRMLRAVYNVPARALQPHSIRRSEC